MLRTKCTVQCCRGQSSSLATRRVQPLVFVRDAEFHAGEATAARVGQELRSKALVWHPHGFRS
jgi:hypothetical protein